MRIRRKYKLLLWYQSLGFGAIVVVTWLDELLSLPTRLFGGVQHSNWREAVIETFVALIA